MENKYLSHQGNVDSQSQRQGQRPSRPSCQSRPSFRQACEIAEAQIGIDYIRNEDKPLARELAMIIAEVYTTRPVTMIRIGPELMDALTVQEVFREIREENVERLIGKFKKITFPIRNVRGYLRTGLYNSVFETEAGIINEVNGDLKTEGL